jgi:hypothetical protein
MLIETVHELFVEMFVETNAIMIGMVVLKLRTMETLVEAMVVMMDIDMDIDIDIDIDIEVIMETAAKIEINMKIKRIEMLLQFVILFMIEFFFLKQTSVLGMEIATDLIIVMLNED